MIQSKISLIAEIPVELSGKRLDQALARLYPAYSRTQLQQWIKSAAVTVDQKICKNTRMIVSAQQNIEVHAELAEAESWQAQAIAIDVVHEDQELMIINKPAGMVVHPGAGNSNGTLANALLHYHPPLKQVPRAGVIHRLDKDTSGLLLIAKTVTAHHQLTQAMKARSIKREYLALVKGLVISGGKVDAAIGRHPTQRTKMAVNINGKTAITHYRVLEKFQAHTLLKLQLETGRTHQIRVHMEHISYPIVGDPLYRRAVPLPTTINEQQREAIQHLERQALHAFRLSLTHPNTQQLLTVEAPLPEDIHTLINVLRGDTKTNV